MKRARHLLLPLALLAALVLGACDGGDDSNADEDSFLTPDMLTAIDSSAQWPFIDGINKVTIHCAGSNELTITTDDSDYPGEYALNGLARQTGQYDDIMDIWADDPDMAGLKINIEPVTDFALSACNY